MLPEATYLSSVKFCLLYKLYFDCSSLSVVCFLKRVACSSYISSVSWHTMAVTRDYFAYCSKCVFFVLLDVIMWQLLDISGLIFIILLKYLKIRQKNFQSAEAASGRLLLKANVSIAISTRIKAEVY